VTPATNQRRPGGDGRRAHASLAMVALFTSALTLLVTSCSASKPPASAAPSHSASPSPDPTATAKQQVVIAYEGNVNAEVKSLDAGTFQGTDIEQYTFEKALYDAKDYLFKNMQSNIVMTGRPSYTIRNVTVDLAPTPHTATVTVCWDNANWTPVDKTTRKSVAAPGQAERYISTSKLRTVGDRWVVIDGSADRGKSC
jgi:hypothetical protein